MNKEIGSSLEVADIFREHGPSYRQNNRLPLQSIKAMNAIEQCRTSSLGGHVYKCLECNHEKISYNPCRNRHCPKCQGIQQAKWVEKRNQELLPINYFHLVFTMPEELNLLTLANPKVMYNILIKASSQTIIQLARQDKHLGATPGCIAVLHTWGQNLMNHPHVHMIVTGGGLTKDREWKSSKKNFFISVKVISKVYRGKFLEMLKDAYNNNELNLEMGLSCLKSKNKFNALLTKLYNKSWVVYAKKPFGNASRVIKYLGRYTHKIAISNHRLVSMDTERVRFKWKDYADNNNEKTMSLTIHEFIRRFLLHILPYQFFKIRYFGMLCSRMKKVNLELCRKLLKGSVSLMKAIKKLMGENLTDVFSLCPKCKKSNMQVVLILARGST